MVYRVILRVATSDIYVLCSTFRLCPLIFIVLAYVDGLTIASLGIACLRIELSVVLDLRVLEIWLLRVGNPVVELHQLVPTLDGLLIFFGQRHASHSRALCGHGLRPRSVELVVIVALPDVVRDSGNAFDVNVVRVKYSIANWPPTLTCQ